MNIVELAQTERLIIRPTSLDDAEFILSLFNSPKWLNNIGDRNVHTTEAAAEYIQSKMLSQLRRLGFSNYTVIRKTDGAKMGICGLYDREGVDGIDIGFAFLPQYEGYGYAFEAANVIKEAAFERFQIKELKAITISENIASQKLLEKIGMKQTGTMKLPGDDEELLVYAIKSDR